MQNKWRLPIAGLIAVIALTLVYLNHFDNPFEFDDSHTIVNNYAIRQFTPGKFFSDARTFSSLPANQAYRPGMTTLNALDYAIWSKDQSEAPQARWFHISIYIGYVLLCLLLYWFYKKIFEYAFPAGIYNRWLAFFTACYFAFHTANAETINYIISRSDSYSTLLVIISFLLYFYSSFAKKTFLFALPMAIGFFVKEPTIMFAPLLFIFIYFFEENGAVRANDIFSKKIKKPLLYAVPLALAGVALLAFAKSMTPETWTSGAEEINRWAYLRTNFYSVVHYIGNFFLPVNLAVDTDWIIFEKVLDKRFIIGLLVVTALLFTAFAASGKKEFKPAAFGILWFFITLIPTSTIFPFAEPNNDHRTFFGYIGLCLAVANFVAVLLYRKKNTLKPIAVASVSVLIIGLYGYGTYQRNEIWGSEEALWQDAAKKCPESGRIWMNLGLAQMKKGDYSNALINYFKAKEKWPDYPYIFVNIGILRNVMGQIPEAEAEFVIAKAKGPRIPEIYYYYGSFLLQHNHIKEAEQICKEGLAISPYNADLLNLKEGIDKALTTLPSPVTVASALEELKKNKTADTWINLSLAFYNAGDYLASIDAARQSLKMNPDYVNAYNNICAAYNMLKEPEKAIEAGEKGLKLAPDNAQLKGNLNFSYLQQKVKKNPVLEDWMNLSLAWYNAKDYTACISCAEEALKINPNYANAWNNICTSYNMLKQYDKAAEAGQKGLRIDPNNQLVAGNLKIALDSLKSIKGK